jgi:hypothetical protein
MNSLKMIIESAKKSIRRDKSAHPHVFEEWQHLQWCKQRKLQAIADYELAKEIWNKLGN